MRRVQILFLSNWKKYDRTLLLFLSKTKLHLVQWHSFQIESNNIWTNFMNTSKLSWNAIFVLKISLYFWTKQNCIYSNDILVWIRATAVLILAEIGGKTCAFPRQVPGRRQGGCHKEKTRRLSQCHAAISVLALFPNKCNTSNIYMCVCVSLESYDTLTFFFLCQLFFPLTTRAISVPTLFPNQI